MVMDRFLVNVSVAILVGVLLVASPVAGASVVLFAAWLGLRSLLARSGALRGPTTTEKGV
ncbi:hypothetical protein [Saccharomonospora halophila]|uniref:hypothetical protein n=1 Tax=Saccharomonospora halophila TaxID=129922 RepID=UPI00036213B7|nr:hypothetical protein [Saccharomonospora halophila]